MINSIIGGEFFSITCFVMPITQTTESVRQKCQTLCYTVEGLNSFGTILYTGYIYFYLRKYFGFSDKALRPKARSFCRLENRFWRDDGQFNHWLPTPFRRGGRSDRGALFRFYVLHLAGLGSPDNRM